MPIMPAIDRRRARTTSLAAATLLAAAGNAQTSCFVLDINGCGCLSFQQFSAMIALAASGDPANSGSGNGDYDADGDVDGVDLAFFLTNFIECADTVGSTRTTLPTPGSVPIVSGRVGDTRQYELLAQLADPMDEVVAVTRIDVTGPGSSNNFVDPMQSSFSPSPLPASTVASLGIDADTYCTIGDRTGEPSPVPPFLNFVGDMGPDQAAFESREAIRSRLGWHSDLFQVGQPGAPGFGGADGNVDNRVMLLGVALDDGQTVDVDIEFAVVTAAGELLINQAFVTLGDAPGCTADVNVDGLLTPADFNAWVVAFNTQGPGCDQNADGLCTPADFNAWVLNFNAGC
ncbi:MAG: GC-type dockerin domain-anchored protein [Planctomycetota bacterium]